MYALENIFPPLPRVVRGKPLIFDADPKGEKLIYVSGNSVVIRSLENTAQNDMYTQHSVHVNVAKYSPSGFYIASADKNGKNHAGFVNVVRYSLDGSFFVSGGADGKLFLHDGEGGEKICEVGSPAHEAGIYGVSFSRESPLCVSASADKSIKLWHVDGKSLSYVAKYSFENILTNMLLGCVWVGRKVATVSLSGSIHIFDVPSDSKSLNPPILSINGHKLHITCAKYNILNSHLITASSDGSMASWDISTGLAEMFSGSNGHSSQIQSMSLMDEYVITVGIDDLCVVSSVNELKHLTSMKLPSQPRCVQSVESKCLLIVVSCLEHMVLLELRNQCLVLLDQLEISLDFSTMSISRNLSLVVVGSQKLGTTSFHITPNQKLNRLSLVNATNTAPEVVAFSPNGEILATAEQDRSINLFSVSVFFNFVLKLDHVSCFSSVFLIYHRLRRYRNKVTFGGDQNDLPTLKSALSEWWLRHSAKITCIGWSPNGRRLATGSIDSSIVIWSLDEPKKPVILTRAHPMSNSTALCWINDDRLLSSAHDGSIRIWRV
ncbi:Actin-interacting protein 1 [Schistosoma japonicum]|nr:Actin-interacting protein 1 [Schistosoma japonicum]